MSLSYLKTYYDYADTACASPVSEINYYPMDTLADCQSAAADVIGCSTSPYFLAFRAECVTTGFRENGAQVFGTSASYVEAYVYTAATCSDSTSLVNLRQYRVGGCYQFSGADGFGGKSRQGALAPTSTNSFVINIFNDTACTVFYQSVTFLADNTTCQNTAFFSAGSYVKMHIVTQATVTAGVTAGATDSSGGLSTGAIAAIAVASLIVPVCTVFIVYVLWRVRQQVRAEALQNQADKMNELQRNR
ncbi:hypothetical protein HDU83_001897 [Entophlyctis luteolus]|nr:hypothetical protein HDU83_001897 [Entophlyctis luteolus]KAJ3380550.1 hypothetical protein HDU84_005743 [Entophlyctis sp. JEL0112]